MPIDLEELDFSSTNMGDLILRRRRIASLNDLEVHEVILGEAFLMSSLFTAVEIAVAELGLAAHKDQDKINVVVGGLGLGYTAQAALLNDSVNEVLVIEALEPVIKWHKNALVPLGEELCSDSRVRFIHGDFFAMAARPGRGFDPSRPGQRADAILLDIDHSPSKNLHPSHSQFYTTEGLRTLTSHLNPGGVFSMWSDDPPEDTFIAQMKETFSEAQAEEVTFFNPLQERRSKSTVYVAKL